VSRPDLPPRQVICHAIAYRALGAQAFVRIIERIGLEVPNEGGVQ
jgi:hypothetical protein